MGKLSVLTSTVKLNKYTDNIQRIKIKLMWCMYYYVST